jgi:hypothetical protein
MGCGQIENGLMFRLEHSLKCSDWNIREICSNWNILCIQECMCRSICTTGSKT